MITTNNEWELSDKSGLVSVGTHSLYVSTAGPPRRPRGPVVIFITGGGAPTESYVHLHGAVSSFARNYFYDRAGYGRSERSGPHDLETAGYGRHLDEISEQNSPVHQPVNQTLWALGSKENLFSDDRDTPSQSMGDDKHGRKITAGDSARELNRLMQAINVQPPYVLAAHSYGGIVARTYFDMYPGNVAGIALLDTNSELLQQCLSPIPPPSYLEVIADVDLEKVLHLREASGMSDEEWNAAMAALDRTQSASADEDTHGSGRDLARKKQMNRQSMGERPLVVMRSQMARDWRLVFEEGKRLGGGSGTDNDMREAERWLESAELYASQVQRVQLELSRNSEQVVFTDMGHDFPIRAPQRTAKVIQRLLTMVKQAASAT